MSLLLLSSKLPLVMVDCHFLFSFLLRLLLILRLPSFAVVCYRLPSFAIVCRGLPSFAVVCHRLPLFAIICHRLPSVSPLFMFATADVVCPVTHPNLLASLLCTFHRLIVNMYVIIIIVDWPNNLCYSLNLYDMQLSYWYYPYTPANST